MIFTPPASFTNGAFPVLPEILHNCQLQVILSEAAIVRVVTCFSSKTRDIFTIKVDLVKSGGTQISLCETQ